MLSKKFKKEDEIFALSVLNRMPFIHLKKTGHGQI